MFVCVHVGEWVCMCVLLACVYKCVHVCVHCAWLHVVNSCAGLCVHLWSRVCGHDIYVCVCLCVDADWEQIWKMAFGTNRYEGNLIGPALL